MMYWFRLAVHDGYLQYEVNGKYTAGQEVSVRYRDKITNAYMLHSYGIAALYNYDNEVKVRLMKENMLLDNLPFKNAI